MRELNQVEATYVAGGTAEESTKGLFDGLFDLNFNMDDFKVVFENINKAIKSLVEAVGEFFALLGQPKAEDKPAK